MQIQTTFKVMVYDNFIFFFFVISPTDLDMLIPMSLTKLNDGQEKIGEISSHLHYNGGHIGFFSAFYPGVLLSSSKPFLLFFYQK